jgi:hypothetical protein
MRVAALALIAGFWSSAALAAAPPVASTPSATEVSPVTVFPKTESPQVVATFPAAGQALSPGVLILTVTFDQKMLQTGFDFAPAAGGEMPDCLKTPRLLDDGKTFVLLCTTLPGKAYALSFNAAPQGGFANVAEHRAQGASLAFTTTTAGDGARTIQDALKAAKLQNVDIPIQDTPGLPTKPAP